MNLQTNKTFGRLGIDQIRRRHPIEKRSDRVADRDNPKLIPFALTEGVASRRVAGEWGEPPAAAFIVNAAGPAAIRRIDLDLITVDAAVVVFGKTVTADLYAAVEFRIDFELELQFKIAPVLCGAEKRIGCARCAGTDNRALFDPVGRLASPLLPALKRLAIKKIGPLGTERRRREQKQSNKRKVCYAIFLHHLAGRSRSPSMKTERPLPHHCSHSAHRRKQAP